MSDDRIGIAELIRRSSIGAAIDDIKTRGIDAHLQDLEQEMKRWHRPNRPKRRSRSSKTTP